MSEPRRKQSEFVKWMGPLLDCLRALGGSAKPREVSDWIAESQKISPEKRTEVLKSGEDRFHNQVAWARQYLVWEGLLDASRRGVWTSTEKGWKTHLSEQDGRTIARRVIAPVTEGDGTTSIEQTVMPPEETADAALLNALRKLSPSGFERVCQRLLRESGFESVTVTGKSHDGGIDGIGVLQVNALVSLKVLFQCKRYKNSVSREQVGDFRNAIIGRADKGIILTTATFSTDAVTEANRTIPLVELIGERLVTCSKTRNLALSRAWCTRLTKLSLSSSVTPNANDKRVDITIRAS
jgi:restriction system protein